MDAGEARMYLQGEVERDLAEAETYIISLDKKNALTVLKKLNSDLFNLARNLQKVKSVPIDIAANVQLCSKSVNSLHNKVGLMMILKPSSAQKKAIRVALLKDLVDLTKEIRAVEGYLAKLEIGERRKSVSR